MNLVSGKKREGVRRSRTEDLVRFYNALKRLEFGVGGKRRLLHCDGRMDWPERGVYFFFGNGEARSGSGNGLRVVRVGTHALISSPGTTLWSRLYQHRGVARTGGGNHRGSVFRKLVGQALIARHPECAIGTWGKGSSAPRDVCDAEFELEQRVSRLIREMPLLWLEVDDEPGAQSRRGYIERKLYRLLSGCNGTPDDPSSRDWLGLHCPREKVKHSGLWNQEHVEDDYDPGFLPELEDLVARQVGEGD